MNLTAYLDGVISACNQEQHATETAAQQALPFSDAMQLEFKQRFSHVCAELDAAQERLSAAESTEGQVKALNWLQRPFAKPSLKGAQEDVAHLKAAEKLAARAVEDAWKAFKAEEETTGTVKAKVAHSIALKLRYDAAKTVRKQTTLFRAKLTDCQSKFPNAPESFSVPKVPTQTSNNRIVQEAANVLKEADDRLDRLAKALEPTRAAAIAANKILSEFITDSEEATRKEGSDLLELRTRASLSKLTRLQGLPTLIDQLRVCTWPNQFRSYADWFVFWSATKAGVDYSMRADGTAINEPPKVSWWCTGWLNAIKNWDTAALANFGLTKTSVGNALFMLENSKAETDSGGDVLIMLAVNDGEKHYCGVASVQFKRGTENSTVINLSQSGGRQYDTIARKYFASNKCWRGIYASLQRDGGGLSSVPAVLIEDTFVPAQVNAGIYTYDARKEAAGEASVNWTANGEALAIALTTCLSNRNTTFGTVDEAFDWAESNNIDKLPDYVLIQAIGESELSLSRALKRLGDLAAQTGQKYELINSIKRRRELGIDPDPPSTGHRFGRGR